MTDSLPQLGAFGLGLLLVGGLYLLVRAARAREGVPPVLHALVESRFHYGVAGVLGGGTVLPALAPSAAEFGLLALSVLATWLGFAAGCSLDLRVLRRGPPAPLLVPVMQAGLVLVLVFLALYVPGRLLKLSGVALSGPALFTVCGICMVGWWRPGPTKGESGLALQLGFWEPAVSLLPGILLIGIGSSQLHLALFQIEYPFGAAGTGVVVAGTAGKLLWGLALGCLTGVIGDLLTRDAEAEAVFSLLAVTLLMGGGVAATLALEPLWVGLAAGVWAINATLRRVDVLKAVEHNHGYVRVGILFGAGWLLGRGLTQAGVDWATFAWMLLLLVALRPAARLGALHLAGRVLAIRALKATHARAGNVLDLDDVALVVAAGLTQVLSAPVGRAVLAAAMVGQLSLRLARVWGERLAGHHLGLAGSGETAAVARGGRGRE